MFSLKNIQFETKRLNIRPFNENDIEDVYNYSKIKGVGENAGWYHHKNITETEIIVKKFIKDKNVLALYSKLDKKVIGSIGLHSVTDDNILKDFQNKKILEIGFVLSKDYWGQGIMLEALKEVIKYIFFELDYDYILAGHFKNNQQSKSVQEKLKFEYYKDDVYESQIGKMDIIYKILRKENFLNK